MQQIFVTSSSDGSSEPSLLYVPPGNGPFPLLVGLHTWSFDRFNQLEDMLPRAQQRGWGLLLPEARGPNLISNPRATQAAAGPLARQDVLDAIGAVLSGYPIDRLRVMMLGGSGGGHLALQVAAVAPSAFAAVSAWVPVTDLPAWHGENRAYAAHLAACCGGAPGTSPAVDAAYRDRSPLHRAAELSRVPLSLHHGRHDLGVPSHHSEDLAHAIERHAPTAFYHEIFDGGHELQYDRAFAWLGSRIAALGTDRQALSG